MKPQNGRNYFQLCANNGLVSRIDNELLQLTNRKTSNPTENFQNT